MDNNITTIFLSMALTIAFTRIVEVKDPSWEIWILFFYFSARKVSYYLSDVKFNNIANNLFKPGTQTERVFILFFEVSTLFLFIVAGYYVTVPIHFFLLSAATLLLNIGWIILLYILIDPTKDKNPKLTVRRIFVNYGIINVLEIIICMIAGIWLYESWTIDKLEFIAIKPWLFAITIGILLFIMFIDLLLHKEFLFDPCYKTDDAQTKL